MSKKKLSSLGYKRIFKFAPIAIIAIVFAVIGSAVMNHVSADQIKIVSSTKWITTDSCLSGGYRMESQVTWGPLRNGKRLISSVKVLPGAQADVYLNDKEIDFTIRVEYKQGEEWILFKKYGPFTRLAPVVWNAEDPPSSGNGDARVRVTSGVDGDGVKGCRIVHESVEPVFVPPVIDLTLNNTGGGGSSTGGIEVSGELVSDGTILAAEKGSYGSLASLDNKGYTKLNVATVADKAGSALDPCSIGSVADPSIKWGKFYCEPFSETWRQQGITGSGSSGWLDRSDIIITSVANVSTDMQARLRVMNTTTNKFQNVKLVRPCDNDKGFCDIGASEKCETVHAGGLAWYKDKLFVADSDCFITFDLNSFYKLSSGEIVLPTTQFWERTSSKLVYSTVALDTTSAVPQLVTTEYNLVGSTGNCEKTYVARWDLSSTTGELALDGGSATLATADKVYSSLTLCEAQGISSHQGVYFINSSEGSRRTYYMYRYRTLANNPADTKFLMPASIPESLYIDVRTNKVWSLSEYPATDGNVRVYNFDLASAID